MQEILHKILKVINCIQTFSIEKNKQKYIFNKFLNN